MVTQPSSATSARRPWVKPTMSGMWAKTLLATTRSARPCSARTAAPVSGVRNAVTVGTPASRAACADVRRRLDAQAPDPPVDHVLQQVSVVARHLDHEGVGPEPEPLRGSATNVRACSTQESSTRRSTRTRVKVSSGVISGGICASQHSVQTRRCSG